MNHIFYECSQFLRGSVGWGELPYNLGHIGICGPKGYAVLDVLAINSVDFDPFVLNRIYNKILDGNWFSARLFME